MISGILPYQCMGQHFRCEMQYDENDPYAFHFVFRQECQDHGSCTELHETTWTVGRELLSKGLDSEPWFGEGDVKLRRDSHKSVLIKLNSPEGITVLSVPRRTLQEFIRLSYNLVDSGREMEQYDWDALDAERVLW